MPTGETPTRHTSCCLAHISVHEGTYALEKLAEVKSARDLTMVLTPGNYDQIHPKLQPTVQMEWMGAFQNVLDLISLNLQIKQVRKAYPLNHYPTLMDQTASKNVVRWAPHANRWTGTVHSHTHSSVTFIPGHVNAAPEAHNPQIVHSSALWDLLGQV